MGRRVRVRPAADVVKEMRYWHETAGVTHICFLEDNTFGKEGRGEELLDEIEKANLSITYSLECGVRADTLTESICQKLKKTGCTAVAIGIENVDPDVLVLMKKGETIEEITNGIRLAKKAGLFVKGYFIVGLPGDTSEKVRKAVEFADREAIDLPRFALAQAFPHTELETWVKEFGHFYIDPYEYVLNHTDEFHGAVHYDFKDFSKDEIWKAYKWAHNQAEAISFRQSLLRAFGNRIGRLLNLLNTFLVRKIVIWLYQHKVISLPK